MKTIWHCALALAMLTGCNVEASTTTQEPGSSSTMATADGQPTEEEVKATIKKSFDEIYMAKDGNAIPERIDYDFGEIQIAPKTRKAVDFSLEPREVYPVKTVVTLNVHFSNNPSIRTVVRGQESNDVFFFYREEFGGWTFKTGSL